MLHGVHYLRSRCVLGTIGVLPILRAWFWVRLGYGFFGLSNVLLGSNDLRESYLVISGVGESHMGRS